MIQSSLSLDEGEKAKIQYIEKMQDEKYLALHENLIALLNMGFIDFEKNVDLLQKNHNNVDVVLSKMFE